MIFSCPVKVPSVSPTLISFMIGSNTYQAEEGMTWRVWVESPYVGSLELRVQGDRITTYDSAREFSTGTKPVSPNDAIQNGMDYVLTMPK